MLFLLGLFLGMSLLSGISDELTIIILSKITTFVENESI